MGDPLPIVCAIIFQAGVVSAAAGETLVQVGPLIESVLSRMGWVFVDPVLEGVDDGDPCHSADYALEVVASAAFCVGSTVEYIEIRGAEKFHGH